MGAMAQALMPFSIYFQGALVASWMEVEPPGLKPEPVWDAGIIGRFFIGYVTTSVPIDHVLFTSVY